MSRGASAKSACRCPRNTRENRAVRHPVANFQLKTKQSGDRHFVSPPRRCEQLVLYRSPPGNHGRQLSVTAFPRNPGSVSQGRLRKFIFHANL